MLPRIAIVWTSLFFGALSSETTAAIHSIDVTADLLVAQYFHNPVSPTGVVHVYPLLQPLDIRIGDVVDMTVRFRPGQSLSMESNGGQQFFSGWLHPDYELSPPGGSNFTISSATLDLFDANANVVLALSSASQTDGSAHIGPLFIGSYVPQGSAISFSGYRTTYEVAALQGGQYYYEGVFLQFANLDGGRLWLAASAIPEPFSAALLMAGLIAAAFTFRGRRA